MTQDPEVIRLVASTARVYAHAERLALELDKTVSTLKSFMREKPPLFEPYREGPHERG